MKVTNILEEQFKDLISEETLKTIEETFQQAVDEKANEKFLAESAQLDKQYAAKLELVIEKIDADHTDKMQTVLEKIDADHTSKLSEAVKAIDSDHHNKLQKLLEAVDVDHAVKLQQIVKNVDKKHTGMLKQIVEKYENQLSGEAKTFQERLVEEVSNYIDLYIDKTLPKDQISEAVSNIRAAKQLNDIRRIVGISEEFVDGEIKEALHDGKRTIDSLRSELNSTLKENADINHKLNKVEAALILEQKTADMPSAKKAFVNKLLKNKAPQYISENFSYVVEMFDKESLEEIDEARDEVISQFTSEPSKADRPVLIEEETNFNTNYEIEQTASSEGVSSYLNEMKRISGSRFTR